MSERIEVDRDEWEATQARLRVLEEGMARLLGAAPEAPSPVVEVAPAQPTSRRRALIGMAAAGAGAAALVAGQASPAAANGQGQSFTLGDNTNTATATTGVTSSSGGGPAVRGTNSASGIGVYGVSGPASAIGGNPAGVTGDSQDQAGVLGISKNGTGVSAFSQNGVGIDAAAAGYPGSFGPISGAAAAVRAQSSTQRAVIALSTSNVAVTAYSDTGVGIEARSDAGVAVNAISTQNTGVVGDGADTGVYGTCTSGSGVHGVADNTGVLGEASGETGAGVAGIGTGIDSFGVFGQSLAPGGRGVVGRGTFPIRVFPAPSNTIPTGSVIGDVWVAQNGTHWASVAVDTWRVVAGPATAGSLHVLAAPARVYDSRPGTAPTGVGPKTKFAANETRTFDLKVNSSTVPAGATAALVTLLLVNASSTPGNATIWANGVAKPLANTMVWGGTGGRFTATATTAVDSLARIQVNASQITDLVIDVVGYYR